MKGGAHYQLPRLRRGYVGVEMGVGDKAVGVSVGSEKVQTKNETGLPCPLPIKAGDYRRRETR